VDKGSKSILIISSEFPPNTGGIGNHAYNLALYLAKEGFEVSVVADIININDDELATFHISLCFKFMPVIRNRFLPKTYLDRVSKALAAARKNSIIICSGKFSLWMVCFIKLFYPFKKYIAVVHGTELDLKKRAAKKLTDFSLARFNAVIAVSSYSASFLKGVLKTRQLQYIIANGVNNDEFSSYIPAGLKNFDNAEGVLSVITVGSVTERKGQENVIRALPEMLKIYPALHYHIAGKPAVKAKLSNLAKALGIGDHVTFHGTMERTALLRLLGGCAVKFMLSNHTPDGDFEGFGIAILEANALGIPAVGANFGGITDAVVDGVTGKLTDVKNPIQIASALKEIILHYDKYSANALHWAQQHDWGILIRKYTAVIENL